MSSLANSNSMQMKTKQLALAVPFLFGVAGQAQTNFKLGGSIMTETVAYPGFILDCEREVFESDKISLPQKLSFGYYSHPRSHDGYFLELQQGFRRYFDNPWVIEHALGIGAFSEVYNETVYEVDDNGNVSEGSKFGVVDLMLAVHFGVGYQLDPKNYLYFRASMFWQYPYNGMVNPHSTLQLGYLYTLKTSSK